MVWTLARKLIFRSEKIANKGSTIALPGTAATDPKPPDIVVESNSEHDAAASAHVFKTNPQIEVNEMAHALLKELKNDRGLEESNRENNP